MCEIIMHLLVQYKIIKSTCFGCTRTSSSSRIKFQNYTVKEIVYP